MAGFRSRCGWALAAAALLLLVVSVKGFNLASMSRRSTPATMSKSNEGVAVLKVLKDAAIKGGLLASAVLGGSSLGGQGAGMPWAQPAAAAVVNLPRCEGGQGEGCEALSEGSEYIKQLQQRSAEKYAERRKQQLVRYNYQNFKDYFAFKGQVLVIRPDGRFIAIEKKVYDQFAKEGKVEGPNWVAKEDPPAQYVDVLESSTDKAPMPVME